MNRRDALQGLGSLALLFGAYGPARGATIVAVRVWPAADYTRVTIESDEKLDATHLLVGGPPRLVVDIDGLELNPTLRELVGKVRPDDPYIAGVRVGQNRPRVVRLVVDLKQDVAPQQFMLEPVAAYRHRLVFDLYPTQERDPLVALVEDKIQAEREAAEAVEDALGDFIGRIDDQRHRPAGPPSTTQAKRRPQPSPALQRKIDRLIVVALDPGHGGEDPGAIGATGLKEKDVVLQIALKLRDRLNRERNMRVMLTRESDFFVPLHERVRKARRVQADLFVSIHADAFINRKAHGASVFALSENGASSAAARWLARRENAADLVGGVNLKRTDAHVMRALLDMSTTAQIKDSLRVGHEVLSGIGRVGRLHKRHVEQAGFAVLKAPDIPSILVETGFITNPGEERKLRSAAYQRELVEALAGGITRYFGKNPPLARHREL